MATPMTGNVLLLDGETRTALAVARSLGRRGVSVSVGSAVQPCLAGRSRYCREVVQYPSPAEQPRRFADSLLDVLDSGRYGLVLPVTDVTTSILTGMIGELPPSTQTVLPTLDTLEMVRDKGLLVRTALAHGIPAPRTWEGVDLADEAVVRSISFPAVVKSRRSDELVDGKWVKGHVRVAHDSTELAGLLEFVGSRTPSPIVQEYIPGWGEGVFVLCNHGKLRALFAHRRLRETPPSGGISTLRESVPMRMELLTGITSFLNALDWHGVAMLEFRVDARDGVPKLLEINPRFWGSLHLALVSGQDFPWLLYAMARDGDVSASFDYTCGVRSRWFLGDFNRLLLELRDAGEGDKSRMQILSSFLRNDRKTYAEIEALDDPSPALLEYSRLVSEYARLWIKRASVHPGA